MKLLTEFLKINKKQKTPSGVFLLLTEASVEASVFLYKFEVFLMLSHKNILNSTF